ncbi:glycosyltransferase family 39 protein, partial [Candidatus Gottesmanbacteria bacterium]|nr:glycosyltransferase family 39 protein [Candidatus Gottesmanbacteria bacterium]
MLPKKNLIFIFLILILSFLLRIYKLDQIPNSISADEASFGYNAYSILKTGKDEFGITFPLLFRSFDDYKNPLFVYTLVPFILMFGLTEWAIRFPSVILGILVVITSFFITRLLIKNNKLSLLTAFFAATSPWLIQYSRVSIDTIIALNFLILGVLFYLLRKKHGFWLLLSSLALALSFWSYHSSRIWAVGFVILTSLYSLFLEKERRKIVLVSVIIFILLCLPYIYISQKTNTYTRLSGISVFADKEDLYQEAYFLKEDLEKGNLLGKLIHNRRLVPLNQAINGYLNILNPQILFSQNKHNQIAQTRLLFLW